MTRVTMVRDHPRRGVRWSHPGAKSMSCHATWEEAVAEAIRLNKVTAEKFPDLHGEGYVYQVAKRRRVGGHGIRRYWWVFTPGALPRRWI